MIREISKKILESFQHLIFPPICLHCHATINGSYSHLCNSCYSQLELIDALGRCPLCFSVEFCLERLFCSHCLQQDHLLNKVAAAFEHAGPAATLVRRLKYADQPYLAKGLAAFMALQLVNLGWPLPDLIVPVPLSFTHWLSRGYNQSLLLAEALSLILSRPVGDILKRRSGDYSQAGLNRTERLKLDSGSFALKKGVVVSDMTLLLIDDVMTTGKTLKCCGEVLLEACPSAIYGLTLCRAVG